MRFHKIRLKINRLVDLEKPKTVDIWDESTKRADLSRFTGNMDPLVGGVGQKK